MHDNNVSIHTLILVHPARAQQLHAPDITLSNPDFTLGYQRGLHAETLPGQPMSDADIVGILTDFAHEQGFTDENSALVQYVCGNLTGLIVARCQQQEGRE